MGMWATAILAYGVDLGDTAPDLFQVEYDGDDYNDGDIQNIFTEWQALQLGVSHPVHGKHTEEEYERAYMAFSEKWPLAITTYGSYSGPGARYFLELEGTRQSASFDDCIAINTDKSTQALFSAFAKEFNLTLPEPQWRMMALYG